MLGLTVEQLLILVGIGLGLIVLLAALRWILSLARVFLRLGCVGIIVVLIVIYVLMSGLMA